MALYTISDLHLSLDNSKSMEVFGHKWLNYMNRIRENWKNCINEGDTVMIPGDVSWATYIEEGYSDFKFINELPGRKIISKGNHDYWWQTAKKMDEYITKSGFNNIYFLHNNSFVCDEILICGSRGWICPESEGYSLKDLKIFEREITRIILSLDSGKAKEHKEIIVFMHYPPFNRNLQINFKIEELLKAYNVSKCVYGHLHGISKDIILEGNINGIEYIMASADYLEFMPLKLSK